jgi:hypothetical protein
MTALSLSLSRAPNYCTWSVKGIRQVLQQVFRVSEWLQANDTLSLSQELLPSVVGRFKVLGRFSNKFLGYPNGCKQMTTLFLSLKSSKVPTLNRDKGFSQELLNDVGLGFTVPITKASGSQTCSWSASRVSIFEGL